MPIAAEVTVGALQMSLSDRSFSGSGQPAGIDGQPLGPSLRLSGDGRALGIVAPVVVQWQVHYLWLTPWHLALGGTFGGVDGNADQAQPQRYGGQTLGSSLSGLIVGPEIAAVFAVGPLELRAGIAAGYRSVGLPVLSFAEVPCGKGGRCHPTLGDDEFFFEPRATVAVHLRSVTIGAYAGGNLTGGMGWSAGGLVGVALPDWRARAGAAVARVRRVRQASGASGTHRARASRYSIFRYNAPSGGSVRFSDAPLPCHGTGVTATRPPLPCPLPPNTRRVAVEDLAPRAAQRPDADAIVVARHRREVAHDEHAVRLGLGLAQKREHRIFGVVGLDPLEAAPRRSRARAAPARCDRDGSARPRSICSARARCRSSATRCQSRLRVVVPLAPLRRTRRP